MISVKNYLKQTQNLIDKNEKTDGCTLTQFMHNILSKAKLLCAAHDYGNLKKIKGIYPGIHNQFYTLAAHLWQINPFYWVWGAIVFTFTMPWILWKRNLKINAVSFLGFHAGLIAISMYSIIFYIAD
jgi:hypothetical protein